MDDYDVESKVHEYIVCEYLIKALDKDSDPLRKLKLGRAWLTLAESLLDILTRELSLLKNQMRNKGCRIVLNEVMPDHVHVMYVYRRYEHSCFVLPYVLKARCEDKLLELVSISSVHDKK